jgi:hypothetical protein
MFNRDIEEKPLSAVPALEKLSVKKAQGCKSSPLYKDHPYFKRSFMAGCEGFCKPVNRE